MMNCTKNKHNRFEYNDRQMCNMYLSWIFFMFVNITYTRLMCFVRNIKTYGIWKSIQVITRQFFFTFLYFTPLLLRLVISWFSLHLQRDMFKNHFEQFFFIGTILWFGLGYILWMNYIFEAMILSWNIFTFC